MRKIFVCMLFYICILCEIYTVNYVQAASNEQLIMANFRDIRDLNPHAYAGEMFIQNLIYDGLIDRVGDDFLPALATNWEVSDDGKTYTFKIRENVKFTDGTRCDAYAIQTNFDAILANKERHAWLTITSVLESVEAINENTLIIKLLYPFHATLPSLAMVRPFAMISPKSMKVNAEGTLETKNGVTSYCGTGAYKLTKYLPNEYALFERNDTYWGEKPKIKNLLVKVLPDNQTRILALRKGEIDFIFGKNMIDADTIESFKKNEKFNFALSKPSSTRHLAFNTNHPILKDQKVRHALSYATNKLAISQGVFFGVEEVAETLYSRFVPYCDIDLTPFSYDFSKAKQLLEESGWKKNADDILEKEGKKFEIQFLYNMDSVTEKDIAQYLQAEYLKLGVIVHLYGEEQHAFFDSMKLGKFDMIFNLAWGIPYDPEASLFAMTMPVHGDYNAQLGLPNKAEIDQNIQDIMISIDEDKRQELFTSLLTKLHESAVYIPLTYECNKAIFANTLKGVELTQSQHEIPLSTMYFEE